MVQQWKRLGFSLANQTVTQHHDRRQSSRFGRTPHCMGVAITSGRGTGTRVGRSRCLRLAGSAELAFHTHQMAQCFLATLTTLEPIFTAKYHQLN